jgi:hypothetical protein
LNHRGHRGTRRKARLPQIGPEERRSGRKGVAAN